MLRNSIILLVADSYNQQGKILSDTISCINFKGSDDYLNIQIDSYLYMIWHF